MSSLTLATRVESVERSEWYIKRARFYGPQKQINNFLAKAPVGMPRGRCQSLGSIFQEVL